MQQLALQIPRRFSIHKQFCWPSTRHEEAISKGAVGELMANTYRVG